MVNGYRFQKCNFRLCLTAINIINSDLSVAFVICMNLDAQLQSMTNNNSLNLNRKGIGNTHTQTAVQMI